MNSYIQKNSLILFTFLISFTLFSFRLHAQSAKSGINFQAIARDQAGNPANNRKIYVESTIVNGTANGVVVFGEHHESNSNEFGVFNIIIGKGERYTGVNDIYSIDWASTKFYFHLRIAITPISPSISWDFNKEWIDIGTVEFGVVPYAIQSMSSNSINIDTAILNTKLNVADTAIILSPYALKYDLINGLNRKLNIVDSSKYVTPFQLSLKSFDTTSLSNRINTRLTIVDTTNMLTPYLRQAQLGGYVASKMNFSDTATMLSPYLTQAQIGGYVNTKLNIVDTTTMLSPYLRQAQLGGYIASKMNFSDTAIMLSPYLRQTQIGSYVNAKLNIVDTANMLSTYLRNSQIGGYVNSKLNIVDTFNMLSTYLRQAQLSAYLIPKLNTSDTLNMLNARFARDTNYLSTRINYKEDVFNKSVDISLIADYNHAKYPTVKAIKDYVDASLIAGAPDATTSNKGILLLAGDLTGTATNPTIAVNAITTNKIADAAVTDAKLASGINPSKVGLGNLTNNAQLYNLNGLTAQVQNFSTPGTTGLAPGWVSTGADHILNIPLASASSVTAGLISKVDFDHFNSAYANKVNSITNIGNNGVASINSNILNIPAYSLVGLAGNINANLVFAGPALGAASAAGFRNLVSADIPNNAANTLGNAATASKLTTPVYLNNVLFDGSIDINNLSANTPNLLTFSNAGLGAVSGSTFNGSVAKEISYNTIGASPVIGSSNITTLGSISLGTWAASVIGSNYGGAGTNNGILKANGSGIVSVALSGTDYIAPFGSQTAKFIYAAPNATNGLPSFRVIEASDIPLLNQNTTGNATTASSLASAVNINGVSFNGLSDITISSNTSNGLTFNSSGLGASSATLFNGSVAKTVSYNTIGAAPALGSTSITTLGSIATGNWDANVIGSNFGGAGTNNGILKANGSGVVSVANAGTDFQIPLTFSSPLLNTSNTISIPQATNLANGYLSNTDWASFNNKIDLSQKASINGVASLDANGKIPTSQIPAISFSSGYVVTSEANMLALSGAVVGSIAIRTDNSKNYVLSGFPATTLANWLELLMPVSVSSVNGHTESNISLTSTDITEGTNLYFTSSRAKNVISATSPLVYTPSSGVISVPAATSSAAGYLTASDWNLFNSKIGAFTAQAANVFYAGPSLGINATPTFRSIVVTDIPTLNQNTTGNAGTATKLAATKNINGVAFDGSADITIASTISNAVTFNNSGTGLTGPTSFDGSLAKTISYNTIGASPLIGSSSISTLGTITAGTWSANIIGANYGGAGTINGILKANGTGVVTAATAGTDFLAPFSSQTKNYIYAAPNGVDGSPSFRSILAADIPILNQATTANAGTATKLAATKNINGVPFDGSSNITIYANVPAPITFDDSGLGGITTTTFNGSVPKTISYNSIGAAPALGSNAIITLGSITTGTWLGTVIDANHGGSGNINGILKANGSGTVSAATAGTDFENPLTFSLPLVRASNLISLSAATTTANGYLTSTDWNLFNGKQSSIAAGTGITITGGNTINIGQTVASTASPAFAGLTISGLNIAGLVTNTAGGVLGTAPTTGTGNIVRATSPTLVTPVLGDASATTINTGTITATSINASSDVTAKRYKLTMPTSTNATTTTNIDLGTGNVFTVSMVTNITSLTFTNAGVGTYLIKFVQDGVGTRDITFPTAWKWAGGVIPSLTNTANKLDIVTLIYDGTTFYATIVSNF